MKIIFKGYSFASFIFLVCCDYDSEGVLYSSSVLKYTGCHIIGIQDEECCIKNDSKIYNKSNFSCASVSGMLQNSNLISFGRENLLTINFTSHFFYLVLIEMQPFRLYHGLLDTLYTV